MLIEKPLKQALETCAKLVDKRIDELLPKDFSDSKIVAAMRYSALSRGKKIRPFLLLTCAEILGVPAKKALDAAVAIEFVHVYSLIHDDLPAMDDDDFRRGILTCHKKFDEATAILAGDALLTYAFEILSNPKTHKNSDLRCELIKILANCAGFYGMVGGQMIDLENSQKQLSKEKIFKLHHFKTGKLFMASTLMAVVLAGASAKQKKLFSNFSLKLGLAFQIKDDIEDSCNFDFKKNKVKNANFKPKKPTTNMVDILGLKNAQKELSLLKTEILNCVKAFGKSAKILQELVNFLL